MTQTHKLISMSISEKFKLENPDKMKQIEKLFNDYGFSQVIKHGLYLSDKTNTVSCVLLGQKILNIKEIKENITNFRFFDCINEESFLQLNV